MIARTKEDVLRCAQSVYSVTPVNTILSSLEEETGPLAYIGLPDQVASIRKLQDLGHPSVRNIRYVFGPYTGTQMYFEAIRSFLRTNGIRSEQEIVSLRYRAGEWPGHLEIKLKDGRTLTAEKFHYNYLIPFFITSSSLQVPDFTNELTDISVGDAWSPRFEKERGGHSVILARSEQGENLLEEMRIAGLLTLQDIPLSEALDMHGHMLDFKKRGSFIRMGWRKTKPDYGYVPASIPASRVMVEWCLRLIFGIGRLPPIRWMMERIPLSVIGPCFNALRKSWKNVSKPTKRRGLRDMRFSITDPSVPERELSA
jgi:coenzyme F420 hydrogenase subunit beta